MPLVLFSIYVAFMSYLFRLMTLKSKKSLFQTSPFSSTSSEVISLPLDRNLSYFMCLFTFKEYNLYDPLGHKASFNLI